jgi:DNA-binding LacI/PurR family transcriptional regulator
MNLFAELYVNPDLPTTLADQLKQQLSWLIYSGKLHEGERLPPVRQLAGQLNINLHTVRAAYHQLESNGLVETRQGRGTTILPVDVQRILTKVSRAPSHTVGVLLPSWSNPFYHTFLQGVEAVADEDQTLIILCNTHDDQERTLRDFSLLIERGVDGIIVASNDIVDALVAQQQGDQRSQKAFPAQKPIPLVTVDWPGARGYSVGVDLETAGYQGTRHLLEHACKRVGLITFLPEVANIERINRGYVRALHEYGLEVNPDWIGCVPGFGLEHGAEGARRLLEQAQPPQAIFCVADMLALGALQAIRQVGLRVPQDIALVGFNDIPLAELVDPALTSVAAPTVQMGKEAMRLLKDLVAGKTPTRRQINLPVQLVRRQSCGCMS